MKYQSTALHRNVPPLSRCNIPQYCTNLAMSKEQSMCEGEFHVGQFFVFLMEVAIWVNCTDGMCIDSAKSNPEFSTMLLPCMQPCARYVGKHLRPI